MPKCNQGYQDSSKHYKNIVQHRITQQRTGNNENNTYKEKSHQNSSIIFQPISLPFWRQATKSRSYFLQVNI